MNTPATTITQKFEDIAPFLNCKRIELPAIPLPEFDSLRVARRFFFPLVRARSRQKRKAMASRLAELVMESRECFKSFGWDRAQYPGDMSPLDPRHRYHRMRYPYLVVIDEYIKFFTPQTTEMLRSFYASYRRFGDDRIPGEAAVAGVAPTS